MAAHLLSLDKIVSGVDSLTSLKELLELYETSLVAEDQYTIPLLVPVLITRLSEVITNHETIRSYQDDSMNSLEQLQNQSLVVISNLKNIDATVFAQDIGNKIQKLSERIFRDLEKLDIQLNKIFLAFNRLIFSASDTYFDNLQRVLLQTQDLIKKKIYQPEWVLQNIEDINAALEDYIDGTQIKDWRIVLGAHYDSIRPNFHLLKELSDQIENRKENNPLISDDLVAAANGLTINFTTLLNDYDAAINDVYRHDTAINSVNEAVACFLLLSGKIKEA